MGNLLDITALPVPPLPTRHELRDYPSNPTSMFRQLLLPSLLLRLSLILFVGARSAELLAALDMLCDEACRVRFVVPEEAGGIVVAGAAAAAEAGADYFFGFFALLPSWGNFVAAGVFDECVSTHFGIIIVDGGKCFLRCRGFFFVGFGGGNGMWI